MARINKACEEKIKCEYTRTKHHIKTNENINHIVHMKNDTKYLNQHARMKTKQTCESEEINPTSM